jgi:hypothetical protein
MEYSDEILDEETYLSYKQLPVVLTDSGLSRWSILFRYHQRPQGGWYRKRENF